MTRYEIICMARAAGLPVEAANIGDGIMCGMVPPHGLERFAAVVAAAEREACAKVCDAINEDFWALYKGWPPYKGNEAGRADAGTQGIADGALQCAAAIRARGEA